MTIKAMLSESIDISNLDQYVNDDEWSIEQKLDGDRIVMHIKNSYPIPVNRHGDPYTKHVNPQILADFSGPEWEGMWVLDGELLDDHYYVFDIALVNPMGDVVLDREYPFSERRRLLEAIFEKWSPTAVSLVESHSTTEAKRRLVDTVKANDGEGVMVKWKNGRYLSSVRSTHVMKAKFTSTLEAFITEVGRGGKRSVAVSLYDNNGKEVDVGSVTMSERNLARVKERDVIEVRYLYCGNGNRLFQPAFLRKRDDKKPEECFTSQLKRVNKEIVYTRR